MKHSNATIAAYALLGFSLSMCSFFLLDETVYHLVRSVDAGNLEIWQAITDIGDSTKWMALLIFGTYFLSLLMLKINKAPEFWAPIPNRSIFVFLAVVTSGAITMSIKGVVGRARPLLYDTEGPFGFDPFSFESLHASWPSGHTTTAFAFATALVLLAPRLKFIVIPLAALAAYSRMALGMHYLADVIAGTTIGVVTALAVYRFLAPKLKL